MTIESIVYMTNDSHQDIFDLQRIYSPVLDANASLGLFRECLEFFSIYSVYQQIIASFRFRDCAKKILYIGWRNCKLLCTLEKFFYIKHLWKHCGTVDLSFSVWFDLCDIRFFRLHDKDCLKEIFSSYYD